MTKTIMGGNGNMCGRDILCSNELTMQEIIHLLEVAFAMKADRFNRRYLELLKNKSFLMLFYSPSFRTHLSFSTAMVDLGGYAQYFEPRMGRFKKEGTAGESVEDIAKVASQYASAVGIRIMEENVKFYGEGHSFIREFSNFANIPVINMADDVCHPCQGMADIMGWLEFFCKSHRAIDFEALNNKKLLLTWGRGSLARSWNSPQETLLIASRFGMNITIARPDGYDFDPEIIKAVKKKCLEKGRDFSITNDPDSGYDDADVVYSRHWISPEAYQNNIFNKEEEIRKALLPEYNNWTTTSQKMKKTKKAIFSHPMPIDRGFEVEDQVASGESSVIYQIANNRLHVEKAILSEIIPSSMNSRDLDEHHKFITTM